MDLLEGVLSFFANKTNIKKSIHRDFIQLTNNNEVLTIHKETNFIKIRTLFDKPFLDLEMSYHYTPLIKGNSSSSIFFSSDFNYTLKIIQNYEFDTLLRIINDYTEYLINNRDTYLVKILGCVTYKTKEKEIRFIIMKNVFRSEDIESIFDLKGDNLYRTRNQYIKKDKEWYKEKKKIEIGNVEKCIEQIKKDVGFLRDLNIMDYSLVISVNTPERKKIKNEEYNKTDKDIDCIKDKTINNRYFENTKTYNENKSNYKECKANIIEYKTNKQNKEDEKNLNVDETYIKEDYRDIIKLGEYSMGIIDILTSYSKKKKIENLFYVFCLCVTNKSCKDPKEYADRFIKNIMKNVIIKRKE
ncbi:phosphatidylinositol 4-phosphate 5-kinase [Vairimorpha necatrix]|uniref:Phosphatidylinositol 4-phosphate 5-kinase n=1 Tax=Vairimorpha necatrix TaxID=6039 RepID=A0AAX4JAC6_9MICR